jgi:uncharacterized membrane protein YvbJ
MRNAIHALIVVLIIVIVIFIYRNYFEFKNSLVNSYIQSEASKYQDSTQAAKLITEAVNHILLSYELTKQVRDYASAANLEPERILVDSAIIQCKSMDYI